MTDRRSFLRMASGSVTASALSTCKLVASALPSADLPKIHFTIDGNLFPPISEKHQLPAMIATEVRSARLSAVKVTVGGTGSLNKRGSLEELHYFEGNILRNPTLYKKVRTLSDIDKAAASDQIGIVFSFEAAEMLEGAVENIDYFHDLGILVMGLSYNKQTQFASGVLVPHSTGLTELGHEAVARMNAVGVTVDLSHSDERSSREAITASTKPTLITHAGCAAVFLHPRNKSDDLLQALANKGGVIGIYELSYLVPYPRQPNLDDYLAHLTHALDVCGEDHVGIGADGFILPQDTSRQGLEALKRENARRLAEGIAAPGEGVPMFVLGLDGPNRYAVIADALQRRGYPPRVVDKVLGDNFYRVFRETWSSQ